MRLVHKVAAGNFKGDAHQPKEETVFLAEGEVIDAFCRNDAGLAEALLASGTLQEILGGIPTLNTLAPGVAADMNPLSAPPVGGMDEIASYTAPDEPDCDEALPAPPPHLRAPRSSARQTVHLRTRGRARRVGLPRAASIGSQSLPEDRFGKKDIRREFEQMLETSLWPQQPVRLPHSDLVKVMRAFPDVSSVELAISTAHHFDVSKQQANVLRRRFAAMVAVEQSVLHHIRRLLPVNATASSSLEAVHNIDAYCKRYEARNTSLPFE